MPLWTAFETIYIFIGGFEKKKKWDRQFSSDFVSLIVIQSVQYEDGSIANLVGDKC